MRIGGHPVGGFLNECGVLDHIIRSMIAGNTGMASLRRAIRAARQQSPRYWPEPALRTKNKWRQIATMAGERAMAMAPNNLTIATLVQGTVPTQTTPGMVAPSAMSSVL